VHTYGDATQHTLRERERERERERREWTGEKERIDREEGEDR